MSGSLATFQEWTSLNRCLCWLGLRANIPLPRHASITGINIIQRVIIVIHVIVALSCASDSVLRGSVRCASCAPVFALVRVLNQWTATITATWCSRISPKTVISRWIRLIYGRTILTATYRIRVVLVLLCCWFGWRYISGPFPLEELLFRHSVTLLSIHIESSCCLHLLL